VHASAWIAGIAAALTSSSAHQRVGWLTSNLWKRVADVEESIELADDVCWMHEALAQSHLCQMW